MAKGDFTFQMNEGDYLRLKKMLDQLEAVDKSEVVKSGLNKGASLLAKAGKAAIKSKHLIKTGNLLKSTGRKVVKKKMYAHIGFKRPKGSHAHIVDRGTKPRYTKKGHYRGKMPASLFWTRIVQTKGDEAIKKVVQGIDDALDKIK